MRQIDLQVCFVCANRVVYLHTFNIVHGSRAPAHGLVSSQILPFSQFSIRATKDIILRDKAAIIHIFVVFHLCVRTLVQQPHRNTPMLPTLLDSTTVFKVKSKETLDGGIFNKRFSVLPYIIEQFSLMDNKNPN